MPPGKVVWLEKRGYAIEVLEDVETAAKQRQRENHETAETRLRRGHYADVYWGGGYLTTDEIEQAMVIGETNHGTCLERIALPHRTWEKRRCHAVRIGNGRGKRRAGICFIGGVHGREWGSPDILIYFAIRLLRAYRDRTDVRIGKAVFKANDIRRWSTPRTSSCFRRSTPTAAASAWIAVRGGGRIAGRRRPVAD